MSARSSIASAEAPSSPVTTPPWLATTFTFVPGCATAIRSWSKQWPGANTAKVLAKAILPQAASPAATPIMLASATPTVKKRSGNSRPNLAAEVEYPRSASTTTMSSPSRASRISVGPSASLVAAAFAPWTTRPRLPTPPPGHGTGNMEHGRFRLFWFLSFVCQLPQGLLGLLGRRRLAVEVRVVLHDPHALPLDRLRHDDVGLSPAPARLLQRADQGVEVVPIHVPGAPAEGRPLIDERFEVHDVHRVEVVAHPASRPVRPVAVVGVAEVIGEAVVLDVVAVDDRDEVVGAVVAGGHRRLPGLAFFAVAVAEHAVHAVVAPVQPPGQRLADSEGETHPQRPGGHLDAGRVLHHGVPLQAAAQLAERQQFVRGEVAGFGHGAVDEWCGVTLADDEPVAVRPLGVAGIVPHQAEVEGGQDLNGRERAGGVAGLRLQRHADDVTPDASGDGLELLGGDGVRPGQAASQSKVGLFAPL